MRLQILAAALCCCALSGCMVANGPQFAEAPPPETGKALVYMYWPKAFAFAARTADMYVDDKKIGSLNAGGYVYAYVEPGRHQFSEKWPFSILAPVESLVQRPVGFTADVHTGEIHYIRFSTSVGSTSGYATALIWQLNEVSPGAGQDEIATERYQKPD